MTLYHPNDPSHFQHRNQLLQTCLRPDPLPFPIEQEYPIVLAPEGRSFSFCHDFQNQLCSHANLWPRKVLDTLGTEQFPVGLVGNVATDPRWRGHGHMRSLLTAVEEIARESQLEALFLWSDLSSFYQKLGYLSVGQEYHFHFLESRPAKKQKTQARLVKMATVDLTDEILKNMLRTRCEVSLTLGRSLEDFRQLLKIPWLELYIAWESGDIVAYTLLGKGYDMMGVIHEWGAEDPIFLLDLIHFIRREKSMPQCMLLAPAELDPSWHQDFLEEASAVEALPMALVKVLHASRSREELQNLFIWGLDSI